MRRKPFAEAEIGRMAERQNASVPELEVERSGGERHDEDARAELGVSADGVPVGRRQEEKPDQRVRGQFRMATTPFLFHAGPSGAASYTEPARPSQAAALKSPGNLAERWPGRLKARARASPSSRALREPDAPPRPRRAAGAGRCGPQPRPCRRPGRGRAPSFRPARGRPGM